MPEIRIVDTTLRDGEQRAGMALSAAQKFRIARELDKMGVYQIEAGIPAMGGQEIRSIARMASAGLRSRISTWNRLSLEDIRASMSCGNVIIHISAPASDIQISTKLKKDRRWVLENLRKCISFAHTRGFEVTVGLEDASRSDIDFLVMLCQVSELEGASRIRYADTVGILHRQRVLAEIRKLRQCCNIDVEMHAHNDLGMAVANSIASVAGGALYVDTTVGGIGERAGNCDFIKFVIAAKGCFNAFEQRIYGQEKLEKHERMIRSIYDMRRGLE